MSAETASKKKKRTDRAILIEALKEQWLSNYQMQLLVQSSSGDRTMRSIRQNPPEGFFVEKRPKDVPEGYNRCSEYKLVRIGD